MKPVVSIITINIKRVIPYNLTFLLGSLLWERRILFYLKEIKNLQGTKPFLSFNRTARHACPHRGQVGKVPIEGTL